VAIRRKPVWSAIAVAVLAIAGCGDDGGGGSSDGGGGATDDSAGAIADPDRFCELEQQLQMANLEALEGVESQEEAEAAFEAFAEENARLIDEQVEVAPEELREAVQLRADGLDRSVAGDELSSDEQQELGEATRQISTFVRDECDLAPPVPPET
jgi:hypothetical protein